MMGRVRVAYFFFFFNDTATTEIYTLSLHDALPISPCPELRPPPRARDIQNPGARFRAFSPVDRKSTRLNSSHLVISYAVFCLKKKKHKQLPISTSTNPLVFTTAHPMPTLRQHAVAY